LVARWLHEKSLRAEGPIVEVNCAAIPSELIESELLLESGAGIFYRPTSSSANGEFD